MRNVVWETTEGKRHKMRYQIMISINYIYTKCNIKYILINGNTIYETLSQWLYLWNLNSISEIFWRVLAFVRTPNYDEDGSCMFKIKYERMVVAKSYLNHELLYIWTIIYVSLVLQQMCAHSLKLIPIPPTPKIYHAQNCKKRASDYYLFIVALENCCFHLHKPYSNRLYEWIVWHNSQIQNIGRYSIFWKNKTSLSHIVNSTYYLCNTSHTAV